MWEGGAAALGRVDVYSDIDLQLAVDDPQVDAIWPAIESALAAISPIEIKYELPRPTWHGHAQAFYRLRDASPYLLLDLVVMKASAEEKFLTPEIHGRVVVHFDKSGVVKPSPLDRAALATRLHAREATLVATFELFRVLVWKEIHRGHALEALAYYQSFTLRPLVELLRIRHVPERHGFFLRYVDHDLPPEVVARLQPLAFVADLVALRAAQLAAESWFAETARAVENR